MKASYYAWRTTLFLLLCTPFISECQVSFENSFHNISVENGLPSSETYMVRQDSKGIIWICSDGGVTRYDGYFFKTFTKKDGLTDNVVFDFYEDAQGRIWFLTYNSLLCYYDGKKVHKYKYNEIIKSFNLSKFVPKKSLYIDDNQTIYYSLKGVGLIKIDSSGNWTNLNNAKNSVEFHPVDDRVIASIDWQVRKKSYNGFNIVRYYEDGSYTEFKPFKLLDNLAVLNEGKSDYAIIDRSIVNINTGKIVHTAPRIHAASSIGDSLFFVCTTQGLETYKLSNDTLQMQRQILSNTPISSANFDSEGGIWISTLFNGIYHSSDLNIEHGSPDSDLGTSIITDLKVIGDDLYLSNNTEWLIFNKDSNKREKNDFQQGFAVKFEDFNGIPVIANKYASEDFKLVDGKIHIRYSKDVATDGNAIYSVHRRVYRYTIHGNKLRVDTLQNNMLPGFPQPALSYTAVVPLDDDVLLLGSRHGVYLLKNKQLAPYSTNPILQTCRVEDIFLSKNREIVIATSENGIFFCKEGKVIQHLTESNGLLSSRVYCISETSEGILLLGTNRGLNYIHPETHQIGHIGETHGLRSGGINCIEEYNGFVFIGTRKGLFRINKNYFSASKTLSSKNVYLESIKVNDEEIDHDTSFLTHPYNTSLLRVRFRTVNYTNWLKKGFQYKLSTSNEWIDISSPEIIIPSPKGDFTIQVRYLLSNNKWSSPAEILSVHENIPYWVTNSFWIGIILSLLGIFSFIFYKVQKQREHRLLLANKVISLEQRIEHVRLNPHFIFNVLNSIQSFILFNEKDKAEMYLTKFSKVMRQMLTKSKDGTIYLNDTLKIISGYLELEKIRHEGGFQFEILNKKNSNPLIPSLIIQPIVENAVIHGLKSKQKLIAITIEPNLSPDTTKVIVVNSGCMSKDQMHKLKKKNDVHALGINQKRLENYNQLLKRNDLGIHFENDEKNEQTIVTITLPNLPVNESTNR